MTGHRQSKAEYLREIASGVLNYYSAQTDSIDITVDGDKARLIGRSRVNAAVHPVFSATGVESDQCLCHSHCHLTDAKFGRFSGRLVINSSERIIVNAEIVPG